MKKKHVIIYTTNGHTRQFSTADMGDRDVQVVLDIQCNGSSITIEYIDIDGTLESETYYGMPYLFKTWFSPRLTEEA